MGGPGSVEIGSAGGLKDAGLGMVRIGCGREGGDLLFRRGNA